MKRPPVFFGRTFIFLVIFCRVWYALVEDRGEYKNA